MQITMQLFIRKIRNRWLSPSTVHKGAPAQVELCFCYCLCLEGIGCTGRTAEQSPVSFGTGCCGLLRKGTRETCGACCWAEMCTYIMISSLDRSCRCFSGLYTSQPTSNRQVTDPWYPFESAAPCILHTSYRWVRPGFHGHGLVAIPVATGTSAWVRHIVASLRVSFPVFVKLVSSMKKGSPLSLSISNTIYIEMIRISWSRPFDARSLAAWLHSLYFSILQALAAKDSSNGWVPSSPHLRPLQTELRLFWKSLDGDGGFTGGAPSHTWSDLWGKSAGPVLAASGVAVGFICHDLWTEQRCSVSLGPVAWRWKDSIFDKDTVEWQGCCCEFCVRREDE